MKTYSEYLNEVRSLAAMRTANIVGLTNPPEGAIVNRSLEEFGHPLGLLQQQARAIVNPQANHEVNQLIAQFTGQLQQVLSKYKS
jgi:hypothetical protein